MVLKESFVICMPRKTLSQTKNPLGLGQTPPKRFQHGRRSRASPLVSPCSLTPESKTGLSSPSSLTPEVLRGSSVQERYDAPCEATPLRSSSVHTISYSEAHPCSLTPENLKEKLRSLGLVSPNKDAPGKENMKPGSCPVMPENIKHELRTMGLVSSRHSSADKENIAPYVSTKNSAEQRTTAAGEGSSCSNSLRCRSQTMHGTESSSRSALSNITKTRKRHSDMHLSEQQLPKRCRASDEVLKIRSEQKPVSPVSPPQDFDWSKWEEVPGEPEVVLTCTNLDVALGLDIEVDENGMKYIESIRPGTWASRMRVETPCKLAYVNDIEVRHLPDEVFNSMMQKRPVKITYRKLRNTSEEAIAKLSKDLARISAQESSEDHTTPVKTKPADPEGADLLDGRLTPEKQPRPKDELVHRGYISPPPARSLMNEFNAAAASKATQVASLMREKRPKIIVLLGAGASTAAGIPDFRSPGSGLYDNLQEYGLPCPTAAFNLGFFRENPSPFYRLARKLWPVEDRKPTQVHNFLKILSEENLLLRCYTQNIDGLERAAGVPSERIVECHGSFRHAYGIDSGKEVPIQEVKDAVFEGGDVASRLRNRYGELVKPGITFFGESLPQRFKQQFAADRDQCEMLIVIGTSLKVAPVSKIVAMVPPTCPRVVINRAPVGMGPNSCTKQDSKCGRLPEGTDSSQAATVMEDRDVLIQGSCDESISDICARLGWESRLHNLSSA